MMNNNRTLHNFRIITFNMLSQDYATNQYFPNVKKHHIEFKSRSEKVKKLLLSWMKVNFIICLQEVSTQWYNALIGLFDEHNYGCEIITYSGDKMGVCIVYPKNHYDILMKNVFVVDEYITKVYEFLAMNMIGNNSILDGNTQTILTEIEEASVVKTPLLSILLDCKSYGKSVNKNLLVSTYHMPCKYTKKYFIAANIHAIKNQLENLKHEWSNMFQGIPISTVLSGDFNIIPESAEYKLLADNEQNDFYALLSKCYDLIGYNLTSGIKTNSVHKMLHGSEPKYTNVSHKNGVPFVDCLDYILIDDSIGIRSCTVGLTIDEPEKTSYPNGLCPSDHVPLSASLFIS